MPAFKNRALLVLLAAALLCACSSKDDEDDNAGPNGVTSMSPGQVDDDVALPSMTMSTSDLMEEAFEACLRVTDMAERQIVSQCSHNPTTMEIVDFFLAQHAEAISSRPLPGSGREAFGIPPSEARLDGVDIEVLSCTTDPFCAGGSCGNMNAFALNNIVVTIDPLLASFAEGAAYWGLLVEDAGGDPASVDEAALFAGLGQIYLDQSKGRPYQTVDEATVVELLETDPFVNEQWMAVNAFLIFHEVGHADLGHGLVKHTSAVGIQSVLAAEGRMLSAEETAQLESELRTLSVFTETQADIYAATLLRELGYTSDGPVVLFTGAMAAFILATGACNSAETQDALFDCALQRDPKPSHPPLDVRATVLRRIVDNGEDLSDQLLDITPPSQ